MPDNETLNNALSRMETGIDGDEPPAGPQRRFSVAQQIKRLDVIYMMEQADRHRHINLRQ